MARVVEERATWRRLLLPATLGIAAYYAVFGGDYNVFEAWRLDTLQTREAGELALLRADVDVLRARTDSLENDPATIERLARERFGMIRDGEILYRFVEDDSTGTKPLTPQ
ncbi:MAG: septum formation initiator family protein [Gemmatimonadota bacterium]